MPPASPTKNRLAAAASPYLRQHEDNPVDWWPWCEQALAKAKAEDRPILLSIGYSACHWCHVMAHECFEDPTIAAQMSRDFVCIKVDREERPDLDQIYQLSVQVMGRGGGWPLTVFLTPEHKPFFAGTYFPPRERHGLPSFPHVMDAVLDAYRNKREDVEAQATELSGAIARATRVEARGEGEGSPADGAHGVNALDALEPGAILERATKLMSRRFDDAHGGFGHRPKFPNTMALDVMLRRSVSGAAHAAHADGADGADGESDARDALAETRVKRTLAAMRAGGVWDQIGGGFHRYSTDERWLVPHFEKMLYDNALLARLYADASRAYGEPRLAEVAHDVLRYVAREMTAADGAFFSTQDADSVPIGAPPGTHAEEGAYFVWTPAEVEAALPGDHEAARVAMLAFGVTARGNFEDPHAGPREPRTVLHEAMTLDAAAAAAAAAAVAGHGLTVAAARAALERASRGMAAFRDQRPRPFRDEKVIASWNALMISACAEVAMATGDTAARAMAERAFEALEARLLRTDSSASGPSALRVMRVSPPPGRSGPALPALAAPPASEPTVAGFLDDYAFVACAALDLYEATATPRYVAIARRVVDAAIGRFADDEGGGFFFAPSDGEALIHRPKDPHDHAIPSGSSMMALALLRLFALDGAPALEARARSTLAPIAQAALENPLGFAQHVIALDRLVRGSTDVVVVGRRDDTRTEALLEAVRRAYVPHRTLAFVDPDDESSLAACPALAAGKEPREHPVAYVCRGRTCSPPVGDAAALARALHP